VSAEKHDWLSRIIAIATGDRLLCQIRGFSIMANITSFQAEILPLFTERDIHAMSKAFNLGKYEEVRAHAAVIYDRIRGIGGAVMPPPPPKGEGPWAQSRIELFAKWMAEGCHP
jgi:hypothetical protein